MTDFLTNLVSRTLGLTATINPVTLPTFAPPERITQAPVPGLASADEAGEQPPYPALPESGPITEDKGFPAPAPLLSLKPPSRTVRSASYLADLPPMAPENQEQPSLRSTLSAEGAFESGQRAAIGPAAASSSFDEPSTGQTSFPKQPPRRVSSLDLADMSPSAEPPSVSMPPKGAPQPEQRLVEPSFSGDPSPQLRSQDPQQGEAQLPGQSGPRLITRVDQTDALSAEIELGHEREIYPEDTPLRPALSLVQPGLRDPEPAVSEPVQPDPIRPSRVVSPTPPQATQSHSWDRQISEGDQPRQPTLDDKLRHPAGESRSLLQPAQVLVGPPLEPTPKTPQIQPNTALISPGPPKPELPVAQPVLRHRLKAEHVPGESNVSITSPIDRVRPAPPLAQPGSLSVEGELRHPAGESRSQIRPAQVSVDPPLLERQPAQAEPPAIQVTIGRIEIRAVSPKPPAKPQPRPPRPQPAMSLDDYVTRRQKERR